MTIFINMSVDCTCFKADRTLIAHLIVEVLEFVVDMKIEKALLKLE